MSIGGPEVDASGAEARLGAFQPTERHRARALAPHPAAGLSSSARRALGEGGAQVPVRCGAVIRQPGPEAAVGRRNDVT